jgi:phage baseplate assembly protein W
MAEVTRISRGFKDISLSFVPHPVTNDLPVLLNERAINRSARNIVETLPGEKFFDSFFGSDVRGLLFELIDFGTATAIEDQILTSLQNYEPRIDDVTVQVDPRPDLNDFEVTITYRIIGEEIPPQTYSFILEATR